MKKPWIVLVLVALASAGVFAATTEDGLRVRRGDDGVGYAERSMADIYAGATAATITMAGTPANLFLGNTSGEGADLTAGLDSDITVDIAAGKFTIENVGDYCVWYTGLVTGEEDKPATLEWFKNGSALGPPHETVVTFDVTAFSALSQNITHRSCVADLKSGDYLQLGVLGSANEVISFTRFNFGIEQVKSDL